MSENRITSSIQLQSDTVIKRAKEILFQQFDDELLAVDAQGSVCYSLNESAGRIWAFIESPTTLGAICAQLTAEYDVDEVTCLQEVSSVLGELREAGLIQLEDHASH